MGRFRKLPTTLYDICEVLGGYRGYGVTKEKGISSATLAKTYGLNVSTVNFYVKIWHSCHDSVLQAIKAGSVNFSQARVLAKYSKKLQTEFLSRALDDSFVSSAELDKAMRSAERSIAPLSQRYSNDGFSGKLTKAELQIQEYLSNKLGAPIEFGRGRSNRIEWRIGYSSRDAAVDLMKQFCLLSEYGDEIFPVEMIYKELVKVGDRVSQVGVLVVRFVDYRQFQNHLSDLATEHGFS